MKKSDREREVPEVGLKSLERDGKGLAAERDEGKRGRRKSCRG